MLLPGVFVGWDAENGGNKITETCYNFPFIFCINVKIKLWTNDNI